jgi:putative glycosyltransferase (TIGR04372 family)
MPRPCVNTAIFELEATDAQSLHPASVQAQVVRLLWRLGRSVAVVGEAIGKEVRIGLEEHAHDPKVPRPVRVRVAALANSIGASAFSSYYLRRLMREPLAIRLRHDAVQRARQSAIACGIDPDRPIVTVHCREAGYKRGREMEAKGGARVDSVRNASIQSYLEAIQLLVRKGFQVVRIGDPSMTPLTYPGVIDLATSPHRTGLVEVASLLWSRFLLCGESGPLAVSFLTNTPVVTVNATDPISAYPVRPGSLYILKRISDRETGRRLSLGELVSERYLSSLRDQRRFAYAENSPEEICEVVEEMLERLSAETPPTAAQLMYRTLATEASERSRRTLPYVRKWGPDDGFLGDGWMGARFVERAGLG